jgi:outer membrane protein OmpA-like peptidoglycan-associated protein
VVVSSAAPVSLPVAAHNLEGGVAKLEEAAGVRIVPSATVSFDFVFTRTIPAAPDGPAPADAPAEASAQAPAPAAQPAPPAQPVPQPATAQPASAALEPEGDFDLAACVGRFEILSRTDNITFRSGSARLLESSNFLLDSIVDIVRRCPGLRIEIGGHTDDVGSDAANQRLSERRAAAVVRYLSAAGVDPAQITSQGYGEARPVVENTSPENRRRNRRIEFRVLDG